MFSSICMVLTEELSIRSILRLPGTVDLFKITFCRSLPSFSVRATLVGARSLVADADAASQRAECVTDRCEPTRATVAGGHSAPARHAAGGR